MRGILTGTRRRQLSLSLLQPPVRHRADQLPSRCCSQVLLRSFALDYSSYHLQREPQVTEHLTAGDLAELLDPSRYVGLSAHFARDLAARARAVATRLAAEVQPGS